MQLAMDSEEVTSRASGVMDAGRVERASRDRAVANTLHSGRAAKERARERPIPEEQPVMRTTLRSSIAAAMVGDTLRAR